MDNVPVMGDCWILLPSCSPSPVIVIALLKYFRRKCFGPRSLNPSLKGEVTFDLWAVISGMTAIVAVELRGDCSVRL